MSRAIREPLVAAVVVVGCFLCLWRTLPLRCSLIAAIPAIVFPAGLAWAAPADDVSAQVAGALQALQDATKGPVACSADTAARLLAARSTAPPDGRDRPSVLGEDLCLEAAAGLTCIVPRGCPGDGPVRGLSPLIDPLVPPVSAVERGLLAFLAALPDPQLAAVCGPAGLPLVDLTEPQVAGLAELFDGEARARLTGRAAREGPPDRLRVSFSPRAWCRSDRQTWVVSLSPTAAPPAAPTRLPAPPASVNAAVPPPPVHRAAVAELAALIQKRSGKQWFVEESHGQDQVLLTANPGTLGLEALKAAMTVPVGLGAWEGEMSAAVGTIPGSAAWMRDWGGEERLRYYGQIVEQARRARVDVIDALQPGRMGAHFRRWRDLPAAVRERIVGELRSRAATMARPDIRLLRRLESPGDDGPPVRLELTVSLALETPSARFGIEFRPGTLAGMLAGEMTGGPLSVLSDAQGGGD